MIFAWIGYLKANAEPIPQSVQEQTNDFLRQPFIRIHSVGQLLDSDGHRAGMMMLFEVDDRPAAEAFVEGSPYVKAGLYREHQLFEYSGEIGPF